MISEVEKDRYGRTVAEIFTISPSGEKFLNEEMVSSGLAYHYTQYSSSCPNKDAIAKAETIAKNQHAGVWSGNYQKPWEYRKAQRNQ